MTKLIASDVLIAGGGLAGIVTALEALRGGKTVTLVDRDTPNVWVGWPCGPLVAWLWSARHCRQPWAFPIPLK